MSRGIFFISKLHSKYLPKMRWPFFYEILSMAIPLVGFNSINIFSSLINGFMLSRLGTTALAAAALIMSIQIMLMMVSTSILFSISSITTRLNAKNDSDAFSPLLQQACLLGIILAFPIILVMLNMDNLLNFFHQPHAIIEYVRQYFNAYWFGIPAAMLLTVFQHFCLGIRKTRVVTLTGIIGFFCTLLFGYALAFGKFGISAKGVYGLGEAQAIRMWLSLIIVLLYFFFDKKISSYQLFQKFHGWSLSYLPQILQLGWPILINALSEYVSLFCLTLLVGFIGSESLLIWQISSQYLLFLSIFILALGQSANIIVGSHLDKPNSFIAQYYSLASIIIAIVITLMSLFIFLLVPKFLLSIYINHNEIQKPDLIHMANYFILFILVGYFFNSTRIILGFILRSMYKTKITMWVNFIITWGFVLPISYFLTKISLGLYGIALTQLVGYVLIAILLYREWEKNLALIVSTSHQ